MIYKSKLGLWYEPSDVCEILPKDSKLSSYIGRHEGGLHGYSLQRATSSSMLGDETCTAGGSV